MKRFLLCYLLLLGMVGGQEPVDDGSVCRPKDLNGVHACHCRLMCSYDENGEPDGQFEDPGSPTDTATRCQKFCLKDRCTCHIEADPKDCANKPGGHE